MAKNSKIEWTKHTANLHQGCVKITAGCDNCYALTATRRWGHDVWGNDKPRLQVMSVWRNLRSFQKEAKAASEMHPVFVGSMMDIFEKPMPLIDHFGNYHKHNTGDLRDLLFKQISRKMYPNLMFLLLTKRPSNINKYIPEAWKLNPPANVMFGTSPVNQATANNLIGHLTKVNGRRFLSVEPQLDRLTLMPWLRAGVIDWVIAGGESGGKRRPYNTDWGRQLRDECQANGVPFFFKQIDKVLPIPKDLLVREFYK